MSETLRMRMFAGPNGSGKSELKGYVSSKISEIGHNPEELLGHYINADDLLKALYLQPSLDFSKYNIQAPNQEDLIKHFDSHPITKKKGLEGLFNSIKIEGNEADFSQVPFLENSESTVDPKKVGSYLAAILADWIRQALLDSRQSFTFETVMSGKDKIELLKQAKSAGYLNYLYFVTTKDVIINVGRVRYRVTQGGHDVPEKLIKDRYTKSLENLKDALRYCYRAYLFDNSAEGENPVFIAELSKEGEMIYKSDEIPEWYIKYVEGQ